MKKKKKNMLKKELFEMFSNQNIYLPAYQLVLLEEEIFAANKKDENILAILDEMCGRAELKKYNDPAKGAYVTDKSNYFASVRKGIKQIDPSTGEVIATYDSIYEASKKFGGIGNAGNISKVLKGKFKTMYGYKWEEA